MPHYILSQDDDLASDNHTSIIDITNLPYFTLVSGNCHVLDKQLLPSFGTCEIANSPRGDSHPRKEVRPQT